MSQRSDRDVVFSRPPEGELLLDLFLPDDQEAAAPDPASARIPVIIWLHGGGWFTGDRTLAPDLQARANATGCAIASIEYRLSGVATFPAQLLDVRAAIRFLRLNADRWHLDPEAIGLWGASAGGHLAALAGVTGEVDEWPGEDSGSADVSVVVQAVAASYPPVDLLSVVAEASAARPDADPRTFPESRLLGDVPTSIPDLATTASPLTHVDSGAPPFQLSHGTGDPLVHHHHSVRLHDALVAAGVESELYLLDGYKHGFLNPAGRLDVQLRAVMDDGRLDEEGHAVAQHRVGSAPQHSASFGFETVDAFFRNHLR